MALRQGADLACVLGAELHILAIVVTTGGLLLDPAVVPGDLLAAERQFLLGAMTEAVAGLEKHGIAAITCIRDGDPADEIIAYALEINADLAVVGHSAQGLLARWFGSSVGTRILATMPCSLLVATDSSLLPAPE